MKKTSLLLLLLLPFALKAQTYFQQEVNYTISVSLDDVKHELNAEESIEYINNSPDQLTFIYMHLWPNGYSGRSTRLCKHMLESGDNKMYYATEEEKGFIDKLDFKVNGKAVVWEYDTKYKDICKLILNEPLRSGDKIVITTPFHVKIPSGKISRLGHIGQSYQITQWYPKPAVYDRKGWNQMPYLSQGEFYSEFGSFNVSITLPKNYVLGATGDMVGGEKEQEWLMNKVKETEAMNSFDQEDMFFPASDPESKTLRFFQTKVHDFAWFCDKRYHVLKGEMETPHTKRKVNTWVMFTNKNADLWKRSLPYVNDALYYYSLWNGDYPYNHATAVDGTISAGGGMEYPNITVIGDVNDGFTLETVIMHEVGHNWFYGMLGSNERQHPWMDEGLNSFNENRYIETKYPNASLFGNRTVDYFGLGRYKHKAQYELGYLLGAKKNQDQPIEGPAEEYTELNYAGIVYSKTALVFDYLMAYIGEKKMDAAMQRYFDEWKFKHPQPNDLRKIMEEVSEKDLSWFFNDMMNTSKKLDYRITSVKKRDDGSWDVGVRNTGEVKGPVQLCAVKNGQLAGVIFYDGFEGKQLLGFPPSEVDYFKIDANENMPEINRNNNRMRPRGLFKKIEPVHFQFMGSLDDPDKSQVFWTPIGGWNNYNKSMLGIAFYNNLFPQKRFEYQFAPMYSFSTGDLAGSGRVAYNWCPDSKLFQQITFSVSGSRFCYSTGPQPYDLNFNKFSKAMDIELKKKRARSTLKQSFSFRDINIWRDEVSADINFDPYVYTPFVTSTRVTDFSYNLKNSRVINPLSATVDYQYSELYSRLSAEANYMITMKGKKKGIALRVFAGMFLSGYDNSFRLSGYSGQEDYLYDHLYLGRSEAFGSNVYGQQFTENDGGFKAFAPYGRSTNWMASFNMKFYIPHSPVGIFFDAGAYPENDFFNDKTQISYDAGLMLTVAKDMFEIYFPLTVSNEIKDNYIANDYKFAETIRFTFYLEKLSPFRLIKDFEL